MPRHARQKCESSVYHVIARGTSRQIIFENDDDRAFFMAHATSRLDESNGMLFAWCLMDNHVHLLLKMPMEALSQFMHALLTDYAGYFNRVHGRTGPLFDGRFRSEPVDSDEYLMTVVRYIHRNPSKAGLTNSLSFPWSSYDEYVNGKAGWTDTQFVLAVFGGKSEFRQFHKVDANDRCLDVPDETEKSFSDAEALQVANELLGEGVVGILKSYPRYDRDAAVVALKDSGLSTRRIQRLTSLSLGTISKAGKRS